MAKVKTGTKAYTTTETVNNIKQYVGYNPKKGRKSFSTKEGAERHAYGLKKIEPLKEVVIKTF